MYSINSLVDDPEATAYAQAQQKQQDEQKAQQEQQEQQDSTTDTDGDPHRFSFVRFFKKIGTAMVKQATDWIGIAMAIFFASIIANEMIVYSVPIRVIFFFFTLFLCLSLTPAVFILSVYYGFTLLYSWYIRYYMGDKGHCEAACDEKTVEPTQQTGGATDPASRTAEKPGKCKPSIFPTLFTLLPVTTYRSEYALVRGLLWIFTYPKNDNDVLKLEAKMEEYKELLEKSFSYYNALKTDAVFMPLIEKVDNTLKNMHGVLDHCADATAKKAKANAEKKEQAQVERAITEANALLENAGEKEVPITANATTANATTANAATPQPSAPPAETI